MAEVQAAINAMKDGKAPGPDKINAEFFKLLNEDKVKWLTLVFNYVYNSGNVPHEWLKSEFVMLLKKPRPKSCDDYRIISLMSHMLKLFLKVIHTRIHRLCEEQISPSQIGFRNEVGTREALFRSRYYFNIAGT